DADAVLARGADAVGVAAEQESRQLPVAGLGLDDVALGRAPIRLFERGAAIADPHIEVELVEAALDLDRALWVAVLADGLDRLVDAEGDAHQHVRARAPLPAGVVEEFVHLPPPARPRPTHPPPHPLP